MPAKAPMLVWADLSAEQLASLQRPKKGFQARDLLAKYLNLSSDTPTQSAILLDMYVGALQFGQELNLPADKLSTLVSIVKALHTRATQDRMPVDRAFTLFKDLLLRHSVQRPPASVGLFTLEEFKAVLEWGLDTYFRLYKLYQYAFTDRTLLSVTQTHPADTVEVPQPLPDLQEAMTQEEHQELVAQDEQQRLAAEEEAAAAAAAAQEAERVARLREEYEAAVPEEIKERVDTAVTKELAAFKEQLEQQQRELLARLDSVAPAAS